MIKKGGGRRRKRKGESREILHGMGGGNDL